MRFLSLSLLLLPFLSFPSVIDACTTIAVGSKASADGSVFAAHSDDGLTDPRLVYIPAKDYPSGSKRPVYYSPENYPRYIGSDRSPTYAPQAGETPFTPIGYIDQISHTYGYWEGTYGIMNEANVGIAESTCSGIYSTSSMGQGGKALFSIDELSHIALERCDTARCAVKTIGKLSEEYGFYGADGGTEGGSESLLIHDTTEAFIFHILPDPTGTSSIWAAQRVPDDGYAVVANMFIIRNIDKSDSENFLFSQSVYSVAIQNGLWNPDSGVPLDFTAVYSDGEYGHKYYSGRRMWIVYQLFSASLNITDEYDNLKQQQVYPTTAHPDKPIGLTDLFNVYRNYYQHTKYDMTVGLASGPWGDPDRFGTWSSLPGSWERSIGIYRTAYTHVTQARNNAVGVQKGIIWFSPHVSSSSPFIPLSASLQQMPSSFAIGNPSSIQRSSAYWASRYLFNVAKARYNVIMKDIVALRSEIELKSIGLVAEIDVGLSMGRLSFSNITALYNQNANGIVNQWWALSDFTIGKNADGYTSQYPDWWLKAVGYQNGPGPAVTENNAINNDNKHDITNNGQYDFKPASFNLIKKEMQQTM